MTREQALELLHGNMQSRNLRRHCYAVEAVMRALALKFKAPADAKAMAGRQGAERKARTKSSKVNEDKWALVGLLHDGDYEKTKDKPKQHTVLMHKWLKDAGETDKEVLDAILSHNYVHTGQNAPRTKMEWALYCCDELTGLIVAVALVRPDPPDGEAGKKLASVTVDSIMKKWDQKAFAAGVHREQIEKCEEKLGIPLREFVGIALKAMQGISKELGL